jgi:RimJ/RimL family protein N-acetyltransferase
MLEWRIAASERISQSFVGGILPKQGMNASREAERATVSLRTARLLLRPRRESDIAGFAAMSADPGVMKFLPPLADRAALETWVGRLDGHWREHGFGRWVVELPGEASFIGIVGLATVPYAAHFTPAVEIAWRLVRAHWGRGHATEAAPAAFDYGFGRLVHAEIVSVAVPGNWRSRRVMEWLGMTRDPADDFDHPNMPDGPLKRHVLYRLRRPSPRP